MKFIKFQANYNPISNLMIFYHKFPVYSFSSTAKHVYRFYFVYVCSEFFMKKICILKKNVLYFLRTYESVRWSFYAKIDNFGFFHAVFI
ncbi:MAG: hypothetical protein A2096_08400 [Spirochaetes bacterium GWF1_41_5]|nr:MAG: hypothetical protein A2096_08400 [Spirochaetes bacterium GWF1_41_5]